MLITAYSYSFDIDVEETGRWYQTYKDRIGLCDCSNCAYYQTAFVHRDYPFFRLLRSMGIHPGRDRDAIWIFDRVEAEYRCRIIGSYAAAGGLIYDDDRYFPISELGKRETDPVFEKHDDYLLRLNFIQTEEREIMIKFDMNVSRFD